MSDTYQSKYTGVEIDERLEWAEEISPHIAKQLNTETGIHGVRYWQDKLEYNDGAGWVEIETRGGGFVVKGLYANLSDLIAAHPTGEAGDAYAVGTAEDNNVYIWSIVSSTWVNIGPLRGEKGDTGAGDMQSSVYDPTGKVSDAFKAANHDYDNSTSGLLAINVQDAIDEVADLVSTHTESANPHGTTKADVGLGNVDNVKQMPIAGGTFTGVAVAQTNTSYTTRQLRNVILSTEDPSGGSNGDIWIKYEED